MNIHYFLLDKVVESPHGILGVERWDPRSTHPQVWNVDNLLTHFDDFSYSNFYNIKNIGMLPAAAYKFIINFIHLPNTAKFAVSKEAVTLLQQDPSVFLVLFSTLECVIDEVMLNEQIQKFNIPLHKVICLTSNLESSGKVLNGIQYHAINFWESYSRFHHRLQPTVSIENAETKKATLQTAQKKFLSLNRNLKPHRIWWMYAMIKADVLEDGHISYHLPALDSRAHKTLGMHDNTTKYIPESLHKDFKHTLLTQMFPRRLDVIDKHHIIQYQDFSKFWQDSCVSFITESDHRRNFLTEKTFKAIANLHPFFIIGNPDQHALLRQRGYYTFEKLFGIDQVTNYKEAMQVLKQVKAMKLDNLKRLIDREYMDKLLHNQNLFFNRKISWKLIQEELIKYADKSNERI